MKNKTDFSPISEITKPITTQKNAQLNPNWRTIPKGQQMKLVT